MHAGKAVLPRAASIAPSMPDNAALAANTVIKDAAARLVSQQSGLAQLYGDLDAAITRTDLPQAVRAAAQSVLSLRMDAGHADALKTAVLKSGLFTEAMLAAGLAPAGDMKTALLSLRQTLQSWLGVSVPETRADPQLPPPFRGAAPVAQQPAVSPLAMLDARAAGFQLLAETDGALARQTLLQIASLPDAVAPQQTDASPKLTMDIPLATPLGTAIIQLQIEHDEERQDGEASREKTWRINLAIDLEPLGPVRASVSQIGGLTHVALMAERKDSAKALRDDLPMLEASLAEAALDVGDLQCRTGKPQISSAPAGLFVDRAS
ncbi:flagellar hook-length control protein FliK [Pseudorhodoplanes sinuspersici]|nr:flagellar hook-length control protein FliK [Pseudorhodoplanes sinuspersici]